MSNKVFIDGQAGTTGLLIYERLKDRQDIELLEIPAAERKNMQVKRQYLNDADLVILCLPDEAAIESVSMIDNAETKVIDASTAHRTAEGWVYGLPELNPGQRELIRNSKRISNPGCYPTGLVLALNPLTSSGLVPADYPITVHAFSGYSGGGNKLIDAYENHSGSQEEIAARPYALNLNQKHVPEMQKWTGLKNPPIFAPAVGNYYKGMLVCTPLHINMLSRKVSPEDVWQILSDYYAGETFVKVMPFNDSSYMEGAFLSPLACNDTNLVELFVFGNADHINLVARLDNLGKGSSGAAVQSLNILLGLDETTGLI